MADLTTEEIAELRLLSKAAHPMASFAIYCWQIRALLDMAERCAKRREEAERFDSEEWTNERSEP